MFAYGMSCLGPAMLALEPTSCGSAVFLRSFVWLGSVTSAYGMACLGASSLVLDLVHPGLLMVLHSLI